MKILQIFGAVVAVHLLAFIFIFASPGCSSSPRNVPTPDSTVPNVSGSVSGTSYHSPASESVAPIDQFYGTDNSAGRNAPTRPGSPNAAAITPARSLVQNVSPVTPYTVEKGDSLWSIAKKHHVTIAELTKANNINSSVALHPGKKLMIPGKPVAAASAETPLLLVSTAPAVTSAPETPSRSSNENSRHIVASGESLGVIARKYQVTVGELAAANNITDPAKIRVGQSLLIPGGRNSGSRSATKSSSKPTVSAPVAKSQPQPVATPVEDKPVEPALQFDLSPPPPGQDLDAGLKENTTTEVPTIKVEEPSAEDETKR